MKHWNTETLLVDGYEIKNAKITSVDLSMADHGVLCVEITLEGGSWGCVYGGYVLGKGYVDADDDYFEGDANGMESIIRIMDVVGVNRFNDMTNKIVRVATKGWGSIIKIIGNVIEEKWFDIDSFYNDKMGE